MTTLTLRVPGGRLHTVGTVDHDNAAVVAAVLERELPLLAQHFGRVSVVLTKNGVDHIITTVRGK
jgi:hypothetical protein